MTLERRFHGFGNLSQLPFRRMKRNPSPFANHFVFMFAPEIFRTYLRPSRALRLRPAGLSEKMSIPHLFVLHRVNAAQIYADLLKPYSTSRHLFPRSLFPIHVSLLRNTRSGKAVGWLYWGIRRRIQKATQTPVSTATTLRGLVDSMLSRCVAVYRYQISFQVVGDERGRFSSALAFGGGMKPSKVRVQIHRCHAGTPQEPSSDIDDTEILKWRDSRVKYILCLDRWMWGRGDS
ncbi:hypothetical protein D9757_012162 [Collybiopsis confluens]|uniref:Uncharacterized protein n=1 Tax=Collybiopsis confluens TaxID=2823264 RepID=A0A8H5G7T5_9AGAR|nr:hypothetical protein D9757_012162 [Collybiopsis confluens]